MTLEERLLESDVKDLPDWAVADILNTPSSEFPTNVNYKTTAIGPGLIMAILGAVEGAVLLDTLETLASSNSVIKWAMKIIDRGELDLSIEATRDQIAFFANAGILTEIQVEKLFNFAKVETLVSWSEYYNIPVDARIVGLTRGGS